MTRIKRHHYDKCFTPSATNRLNTFDLNYVLKRFLIARHSHLLHLRPQPRGWLRTGQRILFVVTPITDVTHKTYGTNTQHFINYVRRALGQLTIRTRLSVTRGNHLGNYNVNQLGHRVVKRTTRSHVDSTFTYGVVKCAQFVLFVFTSVIGGYHNMSSLTIGFRLFLRVLSPRGTDSVRGVIGAITTRSTPQFRLYGITRIPARRPINAGMVGTERNAGKDRTQDRGTTAQHPLVNLQYGIISSPRTGNPTSWEATPQTQSQSREHHNRQTSQS